MQEMTADHVHEDLKPIFAKAVKLPMHRRWFVRFVNLTLRFGAYKTTCLPGVSYSDISLSNTKLRLYQHENDQEGCHSGLGILWIHGGGLIAGNYDVDNKMCSRYVKELNAVVCSAEYRLAPKHPYPSGLDDCYDVWMWFVENAASFGVDPKKIIVAGQSGGGCMAASLCQRILDCGGTQPIAQLLFCPMLDDRTALKANLDKVKHFGWSNENNRAAWSWYLGCDAGSSIVPENAVPGRRKNLSGLPPTWIGIGDIDLFYEESKSYVDRLAQAEIETILDVVEGAPHGFEIHGDGTPLVNDYFQRHFETARRLSKI